MIADTALALMKYRLAGGETKDWRACCGDIGLLWRSRSISIAGEVNGKMSCGIHASTGSSRALRWRMAFEWIWHTRDSVTLRACPISFMVSSSK